MRRVELLQLGILGREAAAGGGVDDEKGLAFVLGEGNVAAILGLYGEIIDAHA